MIMTFLLRVHEQRCAALAFLFKGQPAEILVNQVTVVESRGILVNGRQSTVGKTGQHGPVN